jgi:hypothetical protein
MGQNSKVLRYPKHRNLLRLAYRGDGNNIPFEVDPLREISKGWATPLEGQSPTNRVYPF